MTRLVVASANPRKVRELSELLAGLGYELVSLAELGLAAPEEAGDTFLENALLKARAASRRSALPAIADDSGLEVDALGGAPGVRSARFAGEGADDEANNRKLLALLEDVPDPARTARFRSVVVWVQGPEDPAPLVAEGVWEGRIAPAPRGQGGFGYDPLFLVPGLGRTAAELDPAEKNRLSHRGRALSALQGMLARGGSTRQGRTR